MTPKAELVDITTDDNVLLNGALYEPERPNHTGVDAWLLLPGTMGTFYSAVQKPFAVDLVAAGYPALTLNTRGHGMAWRNRDGRMMGFAYEIVTECPHDIRAALAFLHDRGWSRIGLLGHSLGAIKGFYYLSTEEDPGVAAFAAISAPRMCRSRLIAAPRADEYAANIALAEQRIAEGKGDDPVVYSHPQGPAIFSSRAFVDKYGSDQYDTMALAAHIRTPMLLTRGSKEIEIMPDGYQEEILALAAASHPGRAVTVEGADHFYTGGFHRGAVEAILAWLPEVEAAREAVAR